MSSPPPLLPPPSVLVVFLLLSWCAAGPAANAQEREAETLPVPADTSVVLPDSAAVLQETTARPPGAPTAAAPAAAADDLDQPVQFSARDSLVVEFGQGDGGDRASLFGSASVNYGEAQLGAHRVDILFERDELQASGLPSDTGMVGRPSFQQAGEAFTGESLAFNLRTERGRVVAANTAIQDGFIRAGVVKVTEDSTLYVADGTYTTCDCGPDETPSYSLRSNKMKVVDGEWIYTGPIQLYLFNIPTPLWLPFGFLPAQEGRRSGPLPPRYGEDERGFYLRGWGWYQAINDYMDAQMQFGIWTKGSWQVNPMFRYNRRYRYSGSLSIDYVRNRSGERGDPDRSVFSSSSLRWSHNQTISPTASFNGNVDLSTQNYLRTVSEQYDDRVRSTIGSNVSYRKRWNESGRSLALTLNHRQRLSDGTTDLTLPSLDFSQGSRQPFARDASAPGEARWYERITYTYNGDLSNQYNFDPLPADTLAARGDTAAAGIAWYEALFSPGDFRRATGRQVPFRFQASHRLSTSASFSVTRIPVVDRVVNLNLTPSASYTEDWFVQTERRRFSEAEKRVVTETVGDWMALRQFSTSLSANTTFYGLFPVRLGPWRGLRHVARPSLSLTYRPDFYDDFWGYTDTYVDAQGREQRYALVNGVSRGLQQAVSFNLSNEFLTKRVRPDTAATASSDRPIQLLTLNASTSYNFAADSLRLAPLLLSARTRLFDNQLSLNANATVSAYKLADVGDGLRAEVNRFLFREPGLHFARLTNLSISANTSLRGGASGGGAQVVAPTRAQFDYDPTTPGGDPRFDPTDPYDPRFGGDPSGLGYVDFSIPWSLSLDFSYNYTNRGRGGQSRATLNTSFDFNLTPQWKVRGRSGVDFVNKELVMTSVSVMRDLGCWELAFDWVPFGPYKSYGFDLHVKSGQLRDLLRISQPRADVSGRFGGLLN